MKTEVKTMKYCDSDHRIDIYLENRMTPAEEKAFEMDLKNDRQLKKDFEDMNNLFQLLDNQVMISPPEHLVSTLLTNIKNNKNSNRIILKVLGESLIAAGLFISTFDQYSLLKILSEVSSYISHIMFYLNGNVL